MQITIKLSCNCCYISMQESHKSNCHLFFTISCYIYTTIFTLFSFILFQVEAGIRNLKLSGHVGFDSLPDQLVNKSVQNGFVFNILCIGNDCIVLYCLLLFFKLQQIVTHFYYGQGNENDGLGRVFFIREEIVLAVMRFGVCQ